MSERLATVKDQVGKEMVHLTYNRVDLAGDEKGWSVLGIGPEVIAAFTEFATEVPDDLVGPGWRERAYAATGAVPPELAAELDPAHHPAPAGFAPRNPTFRADARTSAELGDASE